MKTSLNITLGIGIPDLLMNLISFGRFLSNINSVVILNFLKGVGILFLQRV